MSFRNPPIPRMNNTYLAPGDTPPEEIIASVKKGFYAKSYEGGMVQGTGKFTFSVNLGYLIEDGKLTAPLRGVNLIGNGPEVLRNVTMVGNDFELSQGTWTCGKDGQSAPVGIGTPTLKIASITVGGTRTA
jgi:TldD protein